MEHLTKKVDAHLGQFVFWATGPFHTEEMPLVAYELAYTPEEALGSLTERLKHTPYPINFVRLLTKFDAKELMKEVEGYIPKLSPALAAAVMNVPDVPPAAEKPYRELTLLIRDKFAKTALERKVLDALAERIGPTPSIAEAPPH